MVVIRCPFSVWSLLWNFGGSRIWGVWVKVWGGETARTELGHFDRGVGVSGADRYSLWFLQQAIALEGFKVYCPIGFNVNCCSKIS